MTKVSILERLVPSLAFAVAAVSGAAGGLMIFRFFSNLWQAQNAGLNAFYRGVVEIELVVGIMLFVATALCAIGILVSSIRLFTTNTTASPPGLLFLMTGLLSLVPPFAIHYVLHMMKEVVRSPGVVEGGVSGIAGAVTTVSYFAIGSSVVIALVLIAFSFIPFSSRPGRKSSPLVCLMLVEIVIAVLAGIYFWEARTSLVDRDKVRAAEEQAVRDTSDPSVEIPEANSNANDADFTNDGPSNSQITPIGKSISGGVLNDKAIDLPQPEYPEAARAVRATGSVSVQVLVDEKGEVVAATAVSGHPLLRSDALQAARMARFKPTILGGDPVKVTGVLTYNFSGH